MRLNLFVLILCMISACSEHHEQRIKVEYNNQNEGVYFLNEKGLLMKYASVDSNHFNEVINFSYSNSGDIENINSGKKENCFNEAESKKEIEDAMCCDSFLTHLGIKFPLPMINTSELGDMANVFSARDSYKNQENGLEKSFIFDSLYLNIGFRSLIEKYIPAETILNKYEVILRDGKLAKEIFDFDGGILDRLYTYDNQNRLISIVYICQYSLNSKKWRDEKKFFYVKNAMDIH